MARAADVGREVEHGGHARFGGGAGAGERRAANRLRLEPADLRQRRPGSGPRGHHDQQHRERHPRLQHLAGAEPVSLVLPGDGRIHRDAAVAEHGLRLPELQQREQRREAHDRAGDVGQVGPEVHRHRILAGDVAERADHRERPGALHPLAAGHQIQQHPRRQQRQHRHHRADRARQREQRIAGDRGERDDRRAERTERHRRVVGDRGDADRVEIGDAERDENRRHHRPRIAEADQTLEQRAEGPGEQHGLHAHVHAALRDQPAAEVLEHAATPERVEQHHAPEGDPVDVPHAGGGAVEVGVAAVAERASSTPRPRART